MNYISSTARSMADKRRWTVLLGLIVVTACGVEPSESADGPAILRYEAHYAVEVDPGTATATVTLAIQQPRRLLREMSFPLDDAVIRDISGDGEIRRANGALQWLLPDKGGVLRWQVEVPHQRRDQAYDAWLGAEWGIFRAEDLIPRARTRAVKGASSRTTLSFDLPTGWSLVSEYSGARDPIPINRPDRRFDQPTGWLAVGELGVRRERIAGVRVSIAGPKGHTVRRLDMLALLNWTLPELLSMLPEPLPRLTIVSAGRPMWRGGLSAPASLFVHAELPLISENATSPLLHEVMHTALSTHASKYADWIIEGFAEYYSLELLRRGGAISDRRYAAAIAAQANWSKQAGALCAASSTGPTTALAVTVLHALNEEIVTKTRGANSLDDVLRKVASSPNPIDLATLSGIAAELIGTASDALHIDKLPGCSKIAPTAHDG